MFCANTPNCLTNLIEYRLILNERNALLLGFKRSILPKPLDEITTKDLIETEIKKITKIKNKILDYDTIEDIRVTTSKFIPDSKKSALLEITRYFIER